MERAFIFFMGTTQTPLRRKAGSLHSLFFPPFFYFVDLQPQRVMGLFSVELRKESTSSYPLDFLNYSAVQRSAALSRAGRGSLLNVFNVYP